MNAPNKQPFNANHSLDITLLCVIWNELLLLPYFINHYKKLGITHFIFIDNNSNDGTLEYLEGRKDVQITIYHEPSSYASANYGVKWVNNIMTKSLKNEWCLVVDIDELLILPNADTLQDLALKMETLDSNVLQTVLIDFYPLTLNGEEYKQEQSFFYHSCYYHKFTPETIWFKVAPDNSFEIKGGLRHTFSNKEKKPNSTSVCLTKKSFFKYNFYNTHELAAGMHWIMPRDFTCWWPPEKAYTRWNETNIHLKFYNSLMILAHFKFIKPNITTVFKQRVNRNQDWDSSKEYKMYLQNLTHTFHSPHLSTRFVEADALYQNTLNKLNL